MFHPGLLLLAVKVKNGGRSNMGKDPNVRVLDFTSTDSVVCFIFHFIIKV
jgi:hypothetical protein